MGVLQASLGQLWLYTPLFWRGQEGRCRQRERDPPGDFPLMEGAGGQSGLP